MNSTGRADFYALARLAALAIDKGDPGVVALGLDIRAWLHGGCRGDLAEMVGAGAPVANGIDMEGRTAALVAFANVHCSKRKSARGKAARLYELVSRYEASAAYRENEQFAESNPHPIGTDRGDAWEFLRRYRLPSASRIRKIVGHGS